MATYNFQVYKLLNLWRELCEIIVSHVEGPKALAKVREVGRKWRVGQVIVRQVENLKSWEGAKPSG